MWPPSRRPLSLLLLLRLLLEVVVVVLLGLLLGLLLVRRRHGRLGRQSMLHGGSGSGSGSGGGVGRRGSGGSGGRLRGSVMGGGGGRGVEMRNCPQLGGDVDALLHEDAFQQRVLVAKHEDLVGGIARRLLEARQLFFVVLDGGFEVLDVFGPAFAESWGNFHVSTDVSGKSCARQFP